MKKKQAASIAVIGGISIFLIKLSAFFLSNSVALLSDALESIINIVASALVLFSVSIAEKPADFGHKYGHQKIEEISSMVEGLLICLAAIVIVYSAAGRLFESAPLFELNLAIGFSMVATAVNGGLSWFLGHTAQHNASAALEADSKHLLSDVISSVGIWGGLFILQLTGWQFIDSLLAFIVSALIARIGLGLILHSSSHLMDESNVELENKIREVLQRHKSQFVDYHYLKTRRHGSLVLAEMHLTVDSALSVKDAHDFTEHLQEELKQESPNVQIMIHVEPKQ